MSAPAVDGDVPVEKDKGRKLVYFHDDNPLNAHHSIYSDIYIHRWLDAPHDGMEPIPQAEQDRISDIYLADCRAKEKYSDLLKGLIYREKWDEAIAEAPKAVEHYRAKYFDGKKNPWDYISYGESYMLWADALLGAGRVDEAKAKLEEIAALKLKWLGYYKGGKARYPHPTGSVRRNLFWFDPDHLDRLGMPCWNDGKAFPEAQVADYQDQWVACPKISIVLKNVDREDARIRLLALKLRRRGFEYRIVDKPVAGTYPLAIMLDRENCRVQKPEGYSLDASQSRCLIKGCDMQGVLWGIVSFLQILDKDAKRMRVCSIEDWPACPRRGFFGRVWTGTAEYAIFNKMNYVTIKPCVLSIAEYTPFNLRHATEEARDFNGLGLTLFYGFGNMTMDCAWPLCWNVTLARMIEDGKKWAKCGVGIYFPYDDARYWESSTYTEEDRATGLKPSDYDAKFIAKFYGAIKAEYPDFRMQFCPPFYWGPVAGHPYPDDRTKYLKSIAANLPEDIDIIWTGERVGSHRKSQRDCRWFSDLIGRKPSLFQNKTGPHFYLSYIADATHWENWYYDGFVDKDMRSIQKNSDTPQECPQISTLADYCWNPKAYDANRSIKRGLDNYVGRGFYELLAPAHEKLCSFDRYKYGRINPQIYWEDQVKLTNDVAEIRRVTEKARTMIGADRFDSMGSWTRAVGWAAGVAKAVATGKYTMKKLRENEAQYLANNVKYAKEHSNYDEKSDIYFDGASFRPIGIANNPSNRGGGPIPTSRIIANFRERDTGTAAFTLEKAPKQGERMTLVVSGWSTNADMTIAINGTEIFDGLITNIGKAKQKGVVLRSVHKAAKEFVMELEFSGDCLRKGGNELVITTKKWPVEMIYCIIRPSR